MQQKQCSKCLNWHVETSFSWTSAKGKRYRRGVCNPCLWETRKSSPKSVATQKRASRRQHEKRRNALVEGNLYLIAQLALNRYRHSDRKLGMDNDLTQDFVEEAMSVSCTYCGDDESRMTLDRIDNLLGHVRSNVLPACWRCNATRGNMPFEAWKLIAPMMRQAREDKLFGKWKERPQKAKPRP